MSYTRDSNSDNATPCEATNMDANEVLRRYAAGERNFRQQDWRGISLAKANLSGIDLTGALLNYADLRNSDLSYANLNWAGLKGANFKGANLKGAKMPDGKTHNDRLESANYFFSSHLTKNLH
ncbi:pentapeptide repeat-containing protein [Nostoc sp. C117]|uniref:pentapeptide repeat-containing protein n=1 Tax=Nostoc sp. C117 TaxID=3349875 RepID=UPI00370D3378